MYYDAHISVSVDLSRVTLAPSCLTRLKPLTDGTLFSCFTSRAISSFKKVDISTSPKFELYNLSLYAK